MIFFVFLWYVRVFFKILPCYLKQNTLCRYVSESGCAHISQQMRSTSRPSRGTLLSLFWGQTAPAISPSHSHLIPISKLRWNSKKLSLLDILFQFPGDLKSQQVRVTYGDMSRHESQAWHPKNPIKYLTNGCVCPPNIVLRCIKRFWPIPIPETTKIHQPHQPLSCLLLVWHALGSWLHRTVGQ